MPNSFRNRATDSNSALCLSPDRLRSAEALWSCNSAARLAYELQYADGDDPRVSLRITPDTPVPTPAALVIPRSYPGGYSFVPYDDFGEDVHALSPDGKFIECKKGPDGTRWAIGHGSERIAQIHFQDSEQLCGILGYSLFGYIDGLKDVPVTLQVDGPRNWLS